MAWIHQIAEICQRWGGVGVRGVSRMDAAAKPTGTYLRRPRNPTPPRQPTDSPLLRLKLLLQVQGAALSPPLERSRRLERERSTRHRMRERQRARMQIHPRRRHRAIQHITHDGMAKTGHVQAQLVAAAGDRLQFHAGTLRLAIAREHAPTRECRLAAFVVDPLSGAVGPVADQRQLDEPFVELAWAYLNPPTIGRSLLGGRCHFGLLDFTHRFSPPSRAPSAIAATRSMPAAARDSFSAAAADLRAARAVRR